MKPAVYASGDGALHFCWHDKDDNPISGGPKITMTAAKRFLRTKKGKGLAEDGWRIALLDTQPVLVGPVKRVNENTLDLGPDRIVTYTIDKDKMFTGEGSRPYTFYCLTMHFEAYGIGQMEVHNQSMKQRVVHFLNYEKELRAYFNE